MKSISQRTENPDSRDEVMALLTLSAQPFRLETYRSAGGDVQHVVEIGCTALRQLAGRVDRDMLQALESDLQVLRELTAQGVLQILLPTLTDQPTADLRDTQKILREKKGDAKTHEFSLLISQLSERISAHERARQPETLLAHNLTKELAALASDIKLARGEESVLRERFLVFLTKIKQVGAGFNITFLHEVAVGLVQSYPWLDSEYGAAAAE